MPFLANQRARFKIFLYKLRESSYWHIYIYYFLDY